jgi:hypothetical protein
MARFDWPMVVMGIAAGGCKTSCAPEDKGPDARASVADRAGASSKAGPPAAVDSWSDVSRLIREYQDNEARADVMFKGKRIRVVGKIADIKNDVADHIYVTVGTGTRFESPTAQCFFGEAHATEVAALVRGAKVMVDGTCQGLKDNVLMEDCEVPNYALRVCQKLSEAGVAAHCARDESAEPMDSAKFSIPSLRAKNVFSEGKVDALQNGKLYEQMLDLLRKNAEKSTLSPSQTPMFASASARTIVLLLGAEPVPDDVQAKAKAVVEGL